MSFETLFCFSNYSRFIQPVKSFASKIANYLGSR